MFWPPPYFFKLKKNRTMGMYEDLDGKIDIHVAPRADDLPRLGKLKIGIVNEGQKYPTTLDYFRATGKFSDRFHAAHGDKPQQVPVMFYHNDARFSSFHRFEVRDGQGRLTGYGNGLDYWVHHSIAATDKKMGAFVKMQRDEQSKISESQKAIIKKAGGVNGLSSWKQVLTLKLICIKLPDIHGAWWFETQATKSTIPQILSTIDRVRHNTGTLARIPFRLVVEMHKSQSAGDASKYPVVSLIPDIGVEMQSHVKDLLSSNNSRMMGLPIFTGERVLQVIKGQAPDAEEVGYTDA